MDINISSFFSVYRNYIIDLHFYELTRSIQSLGSVNFPSPAQENVQQLSFDLLADYRVIDWQRFR